MKMVDIADAKTHLDRLVEEAVRGEAFVISTAGMPRVKVTAIESSSRTGQRRLGFLDREIRVPDDFDQMGREEIACRFGGNA
jgi:antitoxin (DNA-binding transcriptional repressor) of toxin-antitoxin stability system